MTRREELLKYLSGKTEQLMVEQLVDEIIFQEQQLDELKKLPFINVNPKNPMQQKATPASRMYVSLMAQYNANVRTIARLSGDTEIEEDSPLRSWAKKNANK